MAAFGDLIHYIQPTPQPTTQRPANPERARPRSKMLQPLPERMNGSTLGTHSTHARKAYLDLGTSIHEWRVLGISGGIREAGLVFIQCWLLKACCSCASLWITHGRTTFYRPNTMRHFTLACMACMVVNMRSVWSRQRHGCIDGGSS